MLKSFYNHKFAPKVVLALGFFDCMHKGHQQLLAEAKRLSQQYNALTALFTFDNNHMSVLGKDSKLIYTYEERLLIFQQVGVDVVVTAHFDSNFMALSGQTFLQTLNNNFSLAAVVCGFDYTCGRDRQNSTFVTQFFAQYNIPVCTVDAVKDSCGNKISSTMVRNLLLNHDVQSANAVLSAPFSISGTVVHGRQVGRSIGFPTANIETSHDKLLPSGVYGGYINYHNQRYNCIVNIGNAPTFNFDKPVVEAHIIDFANNLYGTYITVYITQFLREIKKFNSDKALQAQLAQDAKKVTND